MNYKGIPIYIISFNRLNYLKVMVERLERDGYHNIIIIDNASQNVDLLQYLHDSRFKVHFLDKNWGHEVFWKCGLFDDVIQNEYYIVTDPDILPVDECPDDYVELFYRVLTEFPEKTKAGFSLKLNDLPESFTYRMDVIRWESFYFNKILKKNPLLYEADIDTTFALYRPGKITGNFYSAIRTGFPYEARHLPWYTDISSHSEEESFYIKTGIKSGNTFMTDENVRRVRWDTFQNIRRFVWDDYINRQIESIRKFRASCNRMFLYGAGVEGKKMSETLSARGIHFDGFIVTKLVDKTSTEILGRPIKVLDEWKIDKLRDGILLSMDLNNQLEVMPMLYSEKYKNIYRL